MKTTASDFRLFKSECKRWLDFWGIKSWDIKYFHEDSGNGDASTGLNYNQHYATITLSTDTSNDFGRNDIQLWAFHEVCHVLLADYSDVASKREYSWKEHDRVEHDVIVTLENVVFGNKRGAGR